MNPFGFSVRRPVTVSVIVIALIIISITFIPRLGIEGFPNIDIPVIAVTTIYRGAGPEEIEEQVTMTIEEAVGSVGNIDVIESVSQDNLSLVIVEFNYGTDMNATAADVREKIDKIRNELPEEAELPIIQKADPSDSAVVRLTLSDKNINLRRLRSYSRNVIKKELEKVAGVASVDISGGIERAFIAKVDRNRLEALNIPVSQVAQAISLENANIPMGRIKTDELEFSVRSIGEYDDLKDFKNTLITTISGQPVYLRDIATVVDGNKEIRTRARVNGIPCVSISVKKNTDANLVRVADAIKEKADELKPQLPKGFELLLAYDRSEQIKNTIKTLQENALQGAILAVLVVLFFLGSIRSTFAIAISIPVSVLVAMLLLYFSGNTINMITLVGFILVVGNIVDSSIVVLENIYRHLEEGESLVEAAVNGASEVGEAIFAGVMTSIVVFIPLFVVSGLAGQIFTPLAQTFIFALLCSLASAVFVVPMYCSRFMKGEVKLKHNKKSLTGKYNLWWTKTFDKVKDTYTRMLAWCMNNRGWVVFIAFGTFVLSIVLTQFVPTELQGKWDRGDFLVMVETPVGSSIERTDKVVTDVENFVIENTPELDTVIVDVGQGPSGGEGANRGSGEVPRLGGLTVTLKSAEYRQNNNMRSMYEVQDMITERFQNYAGAQIQVQSVFNISGKKPIEILIRGNDLDKLSELAQGLKQELEVVKGLKNLDTNYRPGAPEFKVLINRQKAGQLGLKTNQVNNIIRILLSEDEVSTFREEGNEYEIFVQLPEEQRNSIEKIKTLKFLTPMGKQVTLADIAEVKSSYAPASINRRDRTRYVSVQADLTGRVLSEVLADIQPILDKLELPTGYTYVIAGEAQEQQKIFGEMFLVMRLAIILVYVFLAIQFESFIHPFTLILAVPLELVGVFGSLLITQSTLSMFTLLGVIMLVGVVVNASIVLIDFIIQRKKTGLSTRQAVLEAAPLRLRPILMTVGTTVIAVSPLALGFKAGADLFQPLAISTIGGLLTSTALTLLIIPVVYSIFEDLIEKFTKKTSEKSD
ncbi:MAG: efflux RND transporter permease subunit [Vulcanimicrobiota bacterium]